MSDRRTTEELVEEVARGLRAGYVGGFCPACGAADPFDGEHRAECIFGAGFAAVAELARRLDAAETRVEDLGLRDKMSDDGEHHLLSEIEARDEHIEELKDLLRGFLHDAHHGGLPTEGLRAKARAALREGDTP